MTPEERYLAWLIPLLMDVFPEAVEVNKIQLGSKPQFPIKERPYLRVQLPVVPQTPHSVSTRRHRMVTTITRFGIYEDPETPLLNLQIAEGWKLKDELMRNAPRPFPGALEPLVEQTVYDENDASDAQAELEEAYQTTVVFSVSVVADIITPSD